MNIIDFRGTEIARLALFPQTVDTDRYAREIRAEVNAKYAATNTGSFDNRTTLIYTLVMAGLLRRIQHSNSITDNKEILASALDLLSETCPLIWR